MSAIAIPVGGRPLLAWLAVATVVMAAQCTKPAPEINEWGGYNGAWNEPIDSFGVRDLGPDDILKDQR